MFLLFDISMMAVLVHSSVSSESCNVAICAVVRRSIFKIQALISNDDTVIIMTNGGISHGGISYIKFKGKSDGKQNAEFCLNILGFPYLLL